MTTVANEAGEVRAARLTDRQALADLSGQVHAAADAYRRSLGVPAPTGSPGIELSTLIPSWLPLRSPSVHLVAESDGQLIGSCRAITEPHRDDWVIIELDAADGPMAGEVRWAMLEALIEEGAQAQRGAVPRGLRRRPREHASCSGWPASWPTRRRRSCTAPPETPGRRGGGFLRRRRRSAARRGSSPTEIALQPAGAPDAWHLFDLWTHCTPPAIARVEDYHAADWESVGHEAIVPRSSLNPLLHFGDVSAWLSTADQRAGGLRPARSQPGGAALPPLPRPRRHRRGGAPGRGPRRLPAEAMAAGMLAPVRTYEAAGLSAAASIGFAPVGRVTLLVREVRATVRQPALVPAVN